MTVIIIIDVALAANRRHERHRCGLLQVLQMVEHDLMYLVAGKPMQIN